MTFKKKKKFQRKSQNPVCGQIRLIQSVLKYTKTCDDVSFSNCPSSYKIITSVPDVVFLTQLSVPSDENKQTKKSPEDRSCSLHTRVRTGSVSDQNALNSTPFAMQQNSRRCKFTCQLNSSEIVTQMPENSFFTPSSL